MEYITFDGVSPMANMRKENGRESPPIDIYRWFDYPTDKNFMRTFYNQ